MRKILLFCFCCVSINCSSSLPLCDKALKIRIESRSAVGEKRAMLENEAAGLEDACANERAQSYEHFKADQQRNRR